MASSHRIVMLSVGIGKYQHPKVNPLSLTVADAQAMVAAFSALPDTEVVSRVLLDEAATKAGLQAGVEWLAENVGPDDTALWYYSGHGARYADTSSDDPEAFDEFLCPYDVGMTPGLGSFLRDKEIKEWLKTITAATPNLVAIFDSCHSGDAVQLGEATPKELERGLVEELLAGVARGTEPPGTISTRGPLARHMLLAAAQPHQRSFEIRGMHNGLFTTFLLQGLADPAVTTFYGLFKVASDGVNAEAMRLRLGQTPQLMPRVEGDLALRFPS